jgi:hypothetical protein
MITEEQLDGLKPFEDAPRPDAKEGEKYVVLSHSAIPKGTIIVLNENKQDYCWAYFTCKYGTRFRFWWCEIAPLPKDLKFPLIDVIDELDAFPNNVEIEHLFTRKSPFKRTLTPNSLDYKS